MIDYKKQAEELFEMLVMATGIAEDTRMFNYLCDRYPNLMQDYIKKIEDEVSDADIPELTEEERKRMDDELMERIRKYEDSKKSQQD